VPPRAGNQVELLVDGTAFYPALFAAIDAATTSVHLQSFIIAADPVGRELLDRCIEARQRGVRVRILYDRLGSTAAHFKGFFRRAKAAGLDIRSLSEVWPLRGRFFISMRNHRKIAVIDGATSFIGGINIHGDNSGDATRAQELIIAMAMALLSFSHASIHSWTAPSTHVRESVDRAERGRA
jgi:cardiolipin synthase